MAWWLLWVAIALIAAFVEVVGSGLIFVGIAGAAVLAAIAAAAGANLLVDAIIFALASVGYMAGLRPNVLRLLSGQRTALPGSGSPVASLMGRRGIVTREVSDDGGQIRLGQGEFWSAKLYRGTHPLPIGTRVEIVYVDGLTALVEPLAAEAALPSGQSSSDD